MKNGKVTKPKFVLDLSFVISIVYKFHKVWLRQIQVREWKLKIQ